MNKKLIIAIVAAAALVVAIAFMTQKDSGAPGGPSGDNGERLAAPDPRNATYRIEGEEFPLKSGEALVQTEPGSSIRYKYLKEAHGLLNEDTIEDVGILLTADAGDSGMLTYAVALVNTEAGWQTTNATLLGDRITEQTIDVNADMIVVTYLDRKPGEPFTTAPSVSVTKKFQVRKGILVEVKK